MDYIELAFDDTGIPRDKLFAEIALFLEKEYHGLSFIEEDEWRQWYPLEPKFSEHFKFGSQGIHVTVKYEQN